MYPSIDDTAVATCSKLILKDILRNDLGFTGVVLTDDMGMRGVREHPTLSDAQVAVEALKAGCDVLMYSFRPQRAIDARDAILAAIEKVH
jgi:beta-N-acetylhexosaminidase